MASSVDICNVAMHRLGQDEITSLNDNTKRAALCLTTYPRLLRVMQEEYVWSWGRKRANLAPNLTAPLFTTDYSFAFTIPSDYMRMESMTDYGTDYLIEGNTILSNTNPLPIRYVALVQDPNRMSGLFGEALGLRMAIDMCKLLTGDWGLKESIEKDYARVMASARTADAQSEGEGKVPEDTWLSARNDGFTGPI